MNELITYHIKAINNKLYDVAATIKEGQDAPAYLLCQDINRRMLDLNSIIEDVYEMQDEKIRLFENALEDAIKMIDDKNKVITTHEQKIEILSSQRDYANDERDRLNQQFIALSERNKEQISQRNELGNQEQKIIKLTKERDSLIEDLKERNENINHVAQAQYGKELSALKKRMHEAESKEKKLWNLLQKCFRASVPGNAAKKANAWAKAYRRLKVQLEKKKIA